MKNKKIIILFTIVLLIIILGGFLIISILRDNENENSIEEYTPQEEISEEQLRQTIVSLYFISQETGEIVPEARLVDIKEILNNPCEKLINLLIEGTKNEKYKSIIPENTKLLKTYMEGDCATIDLSTEFLNYDKSDVTMKDKLINSIVKTLTQLTEVNNVKILIDGNENEEFKEIYNREVK